MGTNLQNYVFFTKKQNIVDKLSITKTLHKDFIFMMKINCSWVKRSKE